MAALSLLGLAVVLGIPPTWAHELAPSLFKVTELSEDRYRVVWKTPMSPAAASQRLTPQWPDSCEELSASPRRVEGTGWVRSWELLCGGEGASGLVGQTLSVSGLGVDRTAALVVMERMDGRSAHQVLTARQPEWVVPAGSAAHDVAGDYTVLGVEHIWGGLDHLLFVFGLLLLVGGGRRLLWTTAAFTVGHSITLSIVALGIYSHPVALVELAISLSIFVLAVELARDGRAPLLGRRPGLLAAGFGLLHGMGFAGALAQTGLPQGHVPLALLFFNVGIELGQVVFIVVALGLWAGLRTILEPPHARLRRLPVYGLGAVSAMWCIERAMVFLG